ncbi:endopeptidase La [Candidatus Fokinia crypta]|uniref:Lon protease n=1 Tax=Candidatus Fokinia crypta TaxID=1920990 RepID=A0ABZ0UPU6_9RICK|nr:endopeptidase La [Candidatus Fokinia cryptica]WPX98156.1 Lon protease [Candidatus Fokinia cryptica]
MTTLKSLQSDRELRDKVENSTKKNRRNVAENATLYPVLPLRDIVMFPRMIVPLLIGRKSSLKALEVSTSEKLPLILITQKDAKDEEPEINDLYKVGSLSKTLQVFNGNDGGARLFAEGIERVKIVKFVKKDDYIAARVVKLKYKKLPSTHIKRAALLRDTLISAFTEYAKDYKKIPTDVVDNISKIGNEALLADAIAVHLTLTVSKKQVLLELTDIEKKLEKLLFHIEEEVEVMKTEHAIKERVQNQIRESHKNYYLTQQLKAIHQELGEEDPSKEYEELEKKIEQKKLSAEAKEKALSELKKLRHLNSMSSEAAIIKFYIECILDLPWNENLETEVDLEKAENILRNNHYGMEKVIERILEYLAVYKRTNNSYGSILLFVGPPGVGKTSVASSIAQALGRPLAKISLGGVRDDAEIKGHRRTYVGAIPGRIIHAMRKVRVSNPVILLDEIDKMGRDYRSDPASALLDVLDPVENKRFSDNYLELSYDISNVFFVATANSFDIPAPLLDRFEVIKISGYSEEEKYHIFIRHLLPKQREIHKITEDEVKISEEAVREVINGYTRESGVRHLERELTKICRKAVRTLANSVQKSIVVSEENLSVLLGAKKYQDNTINDGSRLGVVVGLAYTEYGGEVLELEAVLMPGKGNVQITGKLGDVMKESALTAIGYMRSMAQIVSVEPNVHSEKDIHLHVPDGATPKDGPSAGIAICTAIASVMLRIPVRNDVAMTGEVTLTGRVLPIGGLKEKLLAARRIGIKTVLIPHDNFKDLEDIQSYIHSDMKIIGVKSMEEVLKIALTKDIFTSQINDRVFVGTSSEIIV